MSQLDIYISNVLTIWSLIFFYKQVYKKQGKENGPYNIVQYNLYVVRASSEPFVLQIWWIFIELLLKWQHELRVTLTYIFNVTEPAVYPPSRYQFIKSICSYRPQCFYQTSGYGLAGVVQCDGRKTSPRTSTIVQFIFYFWSFEISVNILRNQK